MPCTRRLRFLIGGAASLLRRRPNFGEFPFYELGWIRASRRAEPLRTPAQVSRIGYFRLATLLGLGPLVPDSSGFSSRPQLLQYLAGVSATLVPSPPRSTLALDRYVLQPHSSRKPSIVHIRDLMYGAPR